MAAVLKHCNACDRDLPLSEFYVDDRYRGGYKHQCKGCLKRMRDEREQGPVHLARKAREAQDRTRLRLQVVAGYGGRCMCCGENEEAFLCVDHVDGLGDGDRWPNTGRRISGEMLYRRIIREGFPAAFQLLCFNCNNAKRLFGRCPHEATRRVLRVV